MQQNTETQLQPNPEKKPSVEEYRNTPRWAPKGTKALIFMDRGIKFGKYNPEGAVDTGNGLILSPHKEAVRVWDGNDIVINYDERHGQGPTSTYTVRQIVIPKETVETEFDRISELSENRFSIVSGHKHEPSAHEVSLGGHHE